jgi:hypothetical protein
MANDSLFAAPLLMTSALTSNFQSKDALIAGVTGQDGSYLAELLLGKSDEVHGIKRRAWAARE